MLDHNLSTYFATPMNQADFNTYFDYGPSAPSHAQDLADDFVLDGFSLSQQSSNSLTNSQVTFDQSMLSQNYFAYDPARSQDPQDVPPLGSPFEGDFKGFPDMITPPSMPSYFDEQSYIPAIHVDTSSNGIPSHDTSPTIDFSPFSYTSSSGASFPGTPSPSSYNPFYSAPPASPVPSPDSVLPPPPPSLWDVAQAYPSQARGPMVPQKSYRPHTQSDRRRYVDEVELEAPILFILQNPTSCGIPLRDALSGRYMRLHGRDDAMFIQRGPSVSIRLKWPGYGNWSRQIPTKDFRSPPGPITRAKLAKNIARTVERFIKEKSQRPMDPNEDPKWRVGPGGITVDNLVLVGLQHVSKGSWQCHLRLATPFPPGV